MELIMVSIQLWDFCKNKIVKSLFEMNYTTNCEVCGRWRSVTGFKQLNGNTKYFSQGI